MTHETGDVRQVIEQRRLAREPSEKLSDAEIVQAIIGCAKSWVPEARLLGNLRAGDIARVLESFTAQPSGVERLKSQLESKRVKVLNQHDEIERLRTELADARRERDANAAHAREASMEEREQRSRADGAEAKLASQPAPSGWQQRIAAIAGQPLCPCCATTLVYHGWTNLRTHTRWQCPDCRRFVSIEPLDAPDGQNAVDALPSGPEVKDAIPPESEGATANSEGG